MAVVEIIFDLKNPLGTSANVPKVGEPVFFTNGQYSLGNGIDTIDSLTRYGGIVPTVSVGLSQIAFGDPSTGALTSSAYLLFDNSTKTIILPNGGSILGNTGVLGVNYIPTLTLDYNSGTYLKYGVYNHFSIGATEMNWSLGGGILMNLNSSSLIVGNGMVGGAGGHLRVTKDQNTTTSLTVANNGVGTSVQTAIYLETMYSGLAHIIRYRDYLGSFYDGALRIYNSRNGDGPTAPIMLEGVRIFGLPSTVSTDYMFKQDAVGFRIGQYSTIGNANSYIFQVGDTYYNQAGGRRLWDFATYGQVGYDNSGHITLQGASTVPIYIQTDSGNIVFTSNTGIVNSLVAIDSVAFNLRGNVNAGAYIKAYNINVGTSSGSGFLAINNSSETFELGKLGVTFTTYKTMGVSDGIIYNSNAGGNIVIHNDYASGKIIFAAGGSSTAHLIIKSSGVIAAVLQTGNSGLSAGDLYQDTAANILANGDNVVGMKV